MNDATLTRLGDMDAAREPLEMPVRGRPRNTQPLADLAQGERGNSFPLDQFESAFGQSGTEIPVMVPGSWLSCSHGILCAQS